MLLVAAAGLIASTATLRKVEAQTPVNTYDVNDGKNNVYDNALGELGIDLGGQVPFQRYDDTNSIFGHYYAKAYNASAGGPPTFREWMNQSILDLASVAANIGTYCPGTSTTILPTRGNGRVVDDPAMTPNNPDVFVTWWNGSSGGPQKVIYWSYKINGGSVMICAKYDDSTTPPTLQLNSNPSILLWNYPYHFSAFGTNKNRWQPTKGWSREFQPGAPIDATNPDGIFFAEAVWRGSAGAGYNFGPKEQALEKGDLVVFVQENFSASIWIGLQRTIEADWWVRNEFALAPPLPPWAILPPPAPSTFPPITNLARSFTHGNSWGRTVAPIYCLLAPKVFAGSVEWLMSDYGFPLGDQWDLNQHLGVATGDGGFARTTETIYYNFTQLVDVLGVRFDHPRFGQPGWDVGLLSISHRPSELQVPIYGGVGDSEAASFSPFWARADTTLHANMATNFKARIFRNVNHSYGWGYIPGINEYAVYDGTEWATVKFAPSGPANPRIVPTATPTERAYPDPYTHTLRHVHGGVAPGKPANPVLLTELDLQQGMQPPYRKTGSNVKSIGCGVIAGQNDTMHVADVDGDGNLEVVFGNFDGFVHILEFDPTFDPLDPYRLYEEWKSPYLGWGIGGHDMFYAAGYAQMFFATAKGEIFRINAIAPNSYQVANGGAPIAVPNPANNYLYQGSTPILLANDFTGLNGGKELLVMNRFFDWSMFNVNGGPIVQGRMERYRHIVAPTDAFPMQLDGDAPKEVLITAADGNVWMLDDPTLAKPWVQTSDLGTFLRAGNLALYRVVPCHFNGVNNKPTHLLLFGRNDDLDDVDDDPNNTNPPTSRNVIQLWDIQGANPILVGSVLASATDVFGENMSFAWYSKPTLGSSIAKFVITGGVSLQVFQLSFPPPGSPTMPGSAASIPLTSSLNVFATKTVEQPNVECISSLDVAQLKDGGGVPHASIVLASNHGRIFVLQLVTPPGGSEQIVFQRFSDKEYAVSPPPSGSLPSSAAPVPWPSNRTIARTAACDLDQPQPGNGTASLYFAQFGWSLYSESSVSKYRLGRIVIDATGNNDAWDPFVQEAKNDGTQDSASWDRKFPTFNRNLLYRDLDNDGIKEARVFAETGTAYLDTEASPNIVREFQTASLNADSIFPGGTGVPLAHHNQGGRVFERTLRGNPAVRDYDYLGGFTIQNDPAINYYERLGGGEGWWYPKVGAFLRGQIATPTQSVIQITMGTSMKTAMIRMDGEVTSPTKPHVVVGTHGGFVYVIRPGSQLPSPGEVPSTLRFQSPNLGQVIIGLDVGQLDGDPDDEIVCGNWVDNGTFVDWKNPNLAVSKKRNRGHLILLDPDPTTGAFNTPIELDGDDLWGLGEGIGSGVTGVKIDDVNGDGTNEIWCSDAAGHIYLFRNYPASPPPPSGRNVGWNCVYRSADLGVYPGFYNNLFPIKDTVDFSGTSRTATVKLAVVSPGYVMLFKVVPTLLD